MIGLINAAGASESSRVQSASSRVVESSPKGEGNMIPILNNEQAAARVLRSAVKTILFANGEARRGLPDGEQSDRFDQAELETNTPQKLGEGLDVTA